MTGHQTTNSQEMEFVFADQKRKTGNAGSEVLLWLIQIKAN